ncbi:DNA replication/repair protein RecF [Taibaiella koreensis]|uniref:DNA replication/repair protein RecF n=1 Tax=Taibaiella koreensis TaxID=1268548 RepID=UPI0013C2C7CC|nr:DNA replication and repair protein RecF [Taibaiella koreensis]
MSFLEKISITQFRNFTAETFSFQSPVVGITGLNGVGKTNLLDAIYYLCYTKSYFQSRELNNAQRGTAGFRIEGHFGPEQIVCKWKEGKKTVEHDDVLYEKVTEHIGKYTAVMIAPDDIELINEGSELRRKFIDGLLSQSDPYYLEQLLAYQKYLMQRNALLRQQGGQHHIHSLLDVYDEQLARHGAYLVQEREKLSVRIPALIQQYYGILSGDAEQVGLQYRRCAEPGQLFTLLQRSRQRDVEYKRTLTGPHTEDWLFTIEDNPLKSYASQGQKKSFLVSLKLAHINWLQGLGKKPFLLLDDIFEKLDRRRLLQLFSLLQQCSLSQVFMTHTSADDLLQTVHPYYETVQLLPLGS